MERKTLIGEHYTKWRDALLRNIQIGDKGIKGDGNEIPISDRNEFKKWDELYDDEDAKKEVRKAVKRRVTVLEGQQVKGRECEVKENVVSEQQEKIKLSTYSDEDVELIKDVERKLQSERLQCQTETFIQKEQNLLFDAYGKDYSSDHSVQNSSYHLFSSFQQMMKNINHPLYQPVPTMHGIVNEQRYIHCNETKVFESNSLGQVKDHHWFNKTLQDPHENMGMTVDSFNQYSGVFHLKNLGNIGQLNVNIVPLSTDTVRSCTRSSSETNNIPKKDQLKDNRNLYIEEQIVENQAKSGYTQDNTVAIPMEISSEEEDLETLCSRKRTWSDFYSDVLPVKKVQTASVSADKISKQAVETESTSLPKEKSRVKVKTDTYFSSQEDDTKKKESSTKKWLPESLSFVPCQDSRQEFPPETTVFQDDKISIKIKKIREAAEAKERYLLKTSNMQDAKSNYRKMNVKLQDASHGLEFGKLKNVYGSKRNSPIFDKENISKEMEQFFERPEESSEPEDNVKVEEPRGNHGRKIVIVPVRHSNNQNKSGLNDEQDSVLTIPDVTTFKSNETKSNLPNNSVNALHYCDTTKELKTKFQNNAEKDLPVVLNAKSLNESLDNKTKNIFESEQSKVCDTTQKLNPGRKIVIIPGRKYDSQNNDGLNDEQNSVFTNSNKTKSNLLNNSFNATQKCDTTIEWKTKFQCNAVKDLPIVSCETSLNSSPDLKTKNIFEHEQSKDFDTTQNLKPTNDVSNKKQTTAEKGKESVDMQKGKSLQHVVKDLSSLETFGQTAKIFKSKSEIDLAKLNNTTKAKIDLLRKLDSCEPKLKKCRKGQVFKEHTNKTAELVYKPSLNDEESVTSKFFGTARQSVKYSPTSCPVTGCPGPGNVSLKEHAFKEHLPDIFDDKVTDSYEMKAFKCRKRFNILREIAGSIVKETSLDGLVRFFNQGKRLPPIDLSDSLEAIRECCIHHGWKIPAAFKANPINSISVLTNWHVLLHCVKYMSVKQRIAFKNMCSTTKGIQNIQSCHEKKSNDVDAKRKHEEKVGHSTNDLDIKTNVLENKGATRTTMNTTSSGTSQNHESFDKMCVNKIFESDCIVLSSDEEISVVNGSNTNILKNNRQCKKLDRNERQQLMSSKLHGHNNDDSERSLVECKHDKLCVSNRLKSKEKNSKTVSECKNKKTNEQENAGTILYDEQLPVKFQQNEFDIKLNDLEMCKIKHYSTLEDKNRCLEQVSDKSNATNSFENSDNNIFGYRQKEKTNELSPEVLDTLIIYVCPCGKMATDHDLVFDHLIDHGGKGSIDVVDVVKDKLTPPLIGQDREDIQMFETDDDGHVSESSDDEQVKKKREDADYIAELTALIEEGNDCDTVSNITECGVKLIKENTACHVELTSSVVETPNSINGMEVFKEQGTDYDVYANEENINSSQASTSESQVRPLQLIHTPINSFCKEETENTDQNVLSDVKETSKSCNNDHDLPVDKDGQFYAVDPKYTTETKLSKDGQFFSVKSERANSYKKIQNLNKDKTFKKNGQKSNPEMEQSNPFQDGQFFNLITLVDNNKEDGYQSGQKHLANNIDPKTSIVWKDGNSCPVPGCIGAKEFFNNFTSFDNHWKFYHIPFQVFKRCSICGEQGKRKYNMKKHIKGKHQGNATLITKLLPNKFYIDPGSTERYVHDRVWLHK